LINPDRIRDLIGPGGKNIKAITAATGANIDIEDDGTVRVAAIDSDVAEQTIQLIRSYTSEAEVGKDYEGTVTKIAEFGAFVKIMPGTEGLVHISELSEERIASVDAVVKVGDTILVRVINVDRMGKVRLSHREAIGGAPRPQREGPSGGGDRGGRGGDRGGDRGPRPPRDDGKVPAQGAEQGGRGDRNEAAEERRARRDRG
jgi:polyribonucleotide nucleotidyltransferase